MLEVKTFPKEMDALPIDRGDMKKCLVSGLFEEQAEVQGVMRPFYTYLAEGLHYNQPCLVVAPPSQVPVLSFLEEGPWLALAKKYQFFLHVLVPGEQGYDQDGADAAYMNRVYVQIQARKAYVTMQDNIYACGLGDGAVIAQQAVMQMSSEWSGLASFGDLNEKALLGAELVHGGESTGKTELAIEGTKVQVPVWMGWTLRTAANERVKEYWLTQNDAERTPFSCALAEEVYFPNAVCKTSQVNEEKISQVRVSLGAAKPGEELLAAVWEFLSRACRHRGFGHKMLRNRLDPETYGFTRHTMEVDGFTRLYYAYVPESVKKAEEKVPLVVCMHGRGGSAESFLSLSGLSRVAEERGFVALFPEAGVYQQRPGGIRNTLLWSGSYEGKPMDDVGFILAMVEEAKGRYGIDPGRVYACGQSSGGMMTSRLALEAPGVFAAVSPWSAIVNPEEELVLPEKIEPAVPYFFLFGDKDWLCSDKEKGELEYKVVPDIAAFLKNLMELYHLPKKPRCYRVGEIRYFVYFNEKGVPMLTVGCVANMTHANYPGESWIAYDEFMAKFSRREDGTLLYMGEPAQ